MFLVISESGSRVAHPVDDSAAAGCPLAAEATLRRDRRAEGRSPGSAVGASRAAGGAAEGGVGAEGDHRQGQAGRGEAARGAAGQCGRALEEVGGRARDRQEGRG
jgi:hypothetical protein